MDLRHVLLLTLTTTPLAGCYLHCRNIPERPFTFTGTFTAEELEPLASPEQPSCEELCRFAYERDEGWQVADVRTCERTLPSPDTLGSVRCEGRAIEYFCKGRRPLGYLDPVEHGAVEAALASTLAGFAVLEAASVLAFEQLGVQLDQLGAPTRLIDRCRSAAADERNHARWLTAHAEQLGATVRAPLLEIQAHERLAIAMHNAVEGCVHESFAALVAAVIARLARSDELRRIYARISEDEARHGQLAWDLHAWLLAGLPTHERERVEAARDEALASLPERVGWLARLPRELGTVAPDEARQLARSFATNLQAAA